MDWLSILIVVSLLYASYRVLRIILSPFWPSPLHKIPGPPSPSWVNGNGPEIIKDSAMEPHMRWIAENPDAPLIHYRMFGNVERVMVVDPDAVQLAMGQKKILTKNIPNYDALAKFIGNGLVTLRGKEHTEQRRMIQPAFHLHNLKAMVGTFAAQTKILRDHWRSKMGRGVNVAEDLSKLTFNIIGMTGFGFDFDSMSEDSVGKEATKHLSTVIHGVDSDILRFLLFTFPWLMKTPIPAFRNVARSIEYSNQFVTQVIREKRAQMAQVDAESHQYNNLLEILLASQESRSLPDQQLAEHVKTILFAGHETTATLMLWCLFALSQEPAVAQRLKEELDEWITDEDAITYELVDKLVYLKAVIKETLRMYPPVAIVIRKFEKEFHYQGYTVPAGTTGAVSPYVLHHHPKLWENPEQFQPDRWLKNNNYHPYQFLPFLKGPRNCIGEKFAMLESSVALAILLKEFRFELDQKDWEASRRKLEVTMKPSPLPIMRITTWH